MEKSYTNLISRPSLTQSYLSTDTGAKLAIYPFPLVMIQEMSDYVDGLRIPIETLGFEIFKNGFEVKEKFKYQCKNCSKEFQYKPLKEDNKDDDEPSSKDDDSMKNDTMKKASTSSKNVGGDKSDKGKESEETLQCDSCGSNDLTRPDPQHRKALEALWKDPVNANKQSIKEVAQQLERDLDVTDNAYLLILKNYWIDEAKLEVDWEKTKIAEMLRIDPSQCGFIADSDGRIGYDDNRQKVYVCPRMNHRQKRLNQDTCPDCGTKALKAVIEVNSVYSIGVSQPKRVVYAEGEVIWKAGKYKPGLLYGLSPIYSIWSKAMTLSHMDEYARKYWDRMRPPKGLLIVQSRNYESMKASWEELSQKATEDPHFIHPLLIPTEGTTGIKDPVQWIDFTGSLKDLEFLEMRKEFRQIIGATYGVLPLYFGEMVSGWSQEGLQVTITNRRVTYGQDTLYEAFFEKLARLIGINDWELRLKPAEETDKLRDHQIQGEELKNMSVLKNELGFAVSRTHTGEFKVSKEPDPELEALASGAAGRNPTTGSASERNTNFGGEKLSKRPSDKGGIAQGHPASGPKSSGSKTLSNKGLGTITEELLNLDVINKSNFDKVKSIIAYGIDNHWTPTHIVKELRDNTDMTEEQAMSFLKEQFRLGLNWFGMME